MAFCIESFLKIFVYFRLFNLYEFKRIVQIFKIWITSIKFNWWYLNKIEVIKKLFIMLPTEEVVTEDLKAFERRLTEIISGSALSDVRWKFAFLISFLCVTIGAYYWIFDPARAQDPFLVSIFVVSYIILLVFYRVDPTSILESCP